MPLTDCDPLLPPTLLCSIFISIQYGCWFCQWNTRHTWDYLLLRKQIINLFLERFAECASSYCIDNRSVLIWPISAWTWCDVTASMNRTVSRSKDCFSLLQRIYFCLRLLSSDYVDFAFTKILWAQMSTEHSIAINNYGNFLECVLRVEWQFITIKTELFMLKDLYFRGALHNDLFIIKHGKLMQTCSFSFVFEVLISRIVR